MLWTWLIVVTSVAWLLAGMILLQVFQGHSVMAIVSRASLMMAGLGGLAWLLALVLAKYLCAPETPPTGTAPGAALDSSPAKPGAHVMTKRPGA